MSPWKKALATITHNSQLLLWYINQYACLPCLELTA